MPGTSMQSFRGLPESDRRLLAQEVLRLRREGVRDEITAAFRQEGEEVDEADLRQAVERSTTPGQRVRLPAHWPDPGQAAAKGKAGYAALGCAKCHGDDGCGAADQSLFDDLGEPSRPRDLVHEPFKGGQERESIYLRIAAGMPGTAHPAALNLPEEQLIDLVDYVRSLAREPEYQLTNHERRARASTPAYLQWLKQSSSAPGRPGPSGNRALGSQGA
jgi:mono/diheme cytochrome c family protein